METEWMDIAEFSAYVIAVLVGLDMLIVRCCKCKKKKKEDDPTERIFQDGDDLV
jgi:hypothetical protein